MIVSLIAYLGGTITIENPGIRLELFLKELSRQSGSELKCTAYLKNEVLAAAFQDQSIDIVKAQLARVTHATWEQKSDGWWLIQTPQQKKEETKWNHDQRLSYLKRQIDNLGAMAPSSDWTAKDVEKYWIDFRDARRRTGEGVWTRSQREALLFRSPESRFSEGVAKLLKPEMFAYEGLDLEYRAYSSSGTKNHINLPIQPADVLRRFEFERNQYKVINSDSSEENKPKNLEMSLLRGEIPRLRISAYDENWKHVVTNYAAISALNLPEQKYEIFPLSPTTKTYLEQILLLERSTDPLLEKSKTFEEIAATLRNATMTDPLGILLGRHWTDFAHSVQKPLLANLTDSRREFGSTIKVPALPQPPEAIGSMKRIDEDGWVLGTPINPLFNRTWRIDRSVVAELAATANHDIFLPLDQFLHSADLWSYVAAYSEGIPEQQFISRHNQMINVFGILGTLDFSKVQDCLKGKEIPFTQLPERGQVYAKLLFADRYFNPLSTLTGDGNGNFSSTAVLPNGINGMAIGCSVESQYDFSFAELINEDFDGDGMSLDAFAAAINKAIAKGSSLLDKKLIYSQQQVLTATVRLGDRTLSDTSPFNLSDDQTRYTWKTLPDLIKNVVLEKMKSLPPATTCRTMKP